MSTYTFKLAPTGGDVTEHTVEADTLMEATQEACYLADEYGLLESSIKDFQLVESKLHEQHVVAHFNYQNYLDCVEIDRVLPF